MVGRRISRTADDDAGVAGVVGAVLLLALFVTVFAQVAREDVPVHGAAAERAWSEAAADALADAARAGTDAMSSGAPFSVSLPPPQTAEGIRIPLVGRITPPPATGALNFETHCGSLNATHSWRGANVTDLTNGSRGCLNIIISSSYIPAHHLRYEHGAVLRVQSEGAVVVAGPSLDVQQLPSSQTRVSLTLPSLQGADQSIAADRIGMHAELSPVLISMEQVNGVNAGNVTWTFRTAHPEAWMTWLNLRLREAGLVESRASPAPGESSADYTIECAGNCTSVGGLATVVVQIEGKRVDVDDIRYSLSYGLYDVVLR